MAEKNSGFPSARIKLSGNLGRDPDIKFSKSGNEWANFSIADNWEDRGERKSAWYTVLCFGESVTALDGIGKGSFVKVEGSFFLDEWTDRDGNKRTSPTIKVFKADQIQGNFERPNFDQSGGGRRDDRQQSFGNGGNGGRRNEPAPFEDDDIPF